MGAHAYGCRVVRWASFVFAEEPAIGVAIKGVPSDFERVVVSGALIVASIGTVVLALLPGSQRCPHDSDPLIPRLSRS